MKPFLETKEQFHHLPAADIPIIRREIFHYLGYQHITSDPAVDALVEQCLAEAAPLLTPSSLYSVYPVSQTDNRLDLGFATTDSRNLAKNLEDCHHIVLVASTIGPRFDRLLSKASRTNPLKACILQAIGAMFIESYLDLLNEQLRREAAEQGFSLRPRFSPGYGDLPLALQIDIFRALPLTKIGLSLTDSLLMAPSKSVTAIIGIYSTPNEEP